MAELTPAGFMSYARSDDEHGGGYLTDFRRAIEGELRAQTGEQITIFQDRESILWGQVWRNRLDSGVDSATILLPIITPSFFASAACRKELERFLEREKTLGRSDLIFPLYYIRTPLIDDPESRKVDTLAETVASRQYRDWRPNRFVAIDDLAVRRQIAELVGEIVAALDRGTALPPTAVIVDDDPWADDDEPGFVERVAVLDTAFPALNSNLDDISQLMTRINEVTVTAGAEIDRGNQPGAPSGAKLAAIQRYRSHLEPVAREFEAITDAYSDLVAQVDIGVTTLIAASPKQVEPDDREAARVLLRNMIDLHEKATETFEILETFAQTVEGLLPLSSTTRPAFKSVVRSLRRVVDSRTVYDAWKAQAEVALDVMGETDDEPDDDAGPASS